MVDLKLIELQKFRQGKRQVFVNFQNGIVEWKNNTYKLTYKKVGDKHYPYVVVANIRPLSEIRPLVKQIIKGKSYLKNVEYEMNNHRYFVVGIGPDAIKVYKDDKSEPEFLRYLTTDGQGLLDILVKTLGQSFLVV